MTGCGDFSTQGIPTWSICFQSDSHNRGGVLGVSIHGVLSGVVEERRQRIEISHGERIKLMVVTDCTTRRHPQPDLSECFRPVASIEHVVFFWDRAPFAGGDVAPVEARLNLLIERPVWQQVTRQLFDRELIERDVPIERGNHAFAIRPHFTEVVEMDPVSIRITGRVEPIPSAVFAPLPGLHQLVDQCFIGVGRLVVNERFHQFRGWRKTRQIKTQSSRQCPSVGFRSRR